MPYFSYLLRFIAIPAMMLLTACQDAPSSFNSPTLSFSHLPPYRFDVAQVEVVEEYQSSMRTPHVEHLFPISPAEAVKIWVRDRIHTVGNDGRMEIIVKDASVVEAELPRTKGVKGVFTKDQAERYEARLALQVKIYDGQKLLPVAEVNAQASKSRTLVEGASLAQRDALFDSLTRELLETINRELERGFQEYLTNYMRY